LGTEVARVAFLRKLENFDVAWDLIFFSEFDQNQFDEVFEVEGISFKCHWPGPGSWRLCWAFCARRFCHVSDISTRDRISTLHITLNSQPTKLAVVGIHGPSDERLLDTLSVLKADLTKSRRCHGVLVVGDWNIDLLPSLTDDPWKDLPGRDEKHKHERAQLEMLAETSRLEIRVPDIVIGSPGGRYMDAVSCVPASRVPSGMCALTDKPSLVDYCLHSRRLDISSCVNWDCAISDHGVLQVRMALANAWRRPPRKRWCCVDEKACLRAAESLQNSSYGTLSILADSARKLQYDHDSHERAATRSRRRLPDHIRGLWSEASRSTCEAERRSLFIHARELLHEHLVQAKAQKVIADISRGRVVARSKTLHTITAVQGQDDDEAAANAVSTDFISKWAVDNPDRLASLEALCARLRGNFVHFSCAEVRQAFAKLRHKRRLGSDGTCSAVFEILFIANPDVFVQCLCTGICDLAQLMRFTICARAYGKASSKPKANECRVILPLPPLLQIFDALLSSWIHDTLGCILPSPPVLWEGAVAGTQCLDIATTCHIGQEKILDSHSQGCVVQADIQRFYDSIDLHKCISFIVERGADPAKALAVILCQLYVPVSVTLLQRTVNLGVRTIGALTGSRTAGAIARIPVIDAMTQCASRILRFSFNLHGATIPVMTWVDNLFWIGRSVRTATGTINHIGQVLETKWGLKLKPSSKIALIPPGTQDKLGDITGWAFATSFPCLGHHIDANGGIRTCFEAATRAAWRAFWANCCTSIRLSPDAKFKLLSRSVQSVISYRLSRWPPSKYYMEQLEAMQRKMMTTIAHTRPLIGETWDAYHVRRSVIIRELFERNGSWVDFWIQRWQSWDAHLQRHPELPASKLLTYRNAAWLRAQRSTFAPTFAISSRSWTSAAGRTATRAAPGFIAKRWSEARESMY